MSFFDITKAGQDFAEQSGMFGENFVYQNVAFRGVFDQQVVDWQFSDESFRKITALICVTSKPQWVAANVVPANRGLLTYDNIAYPIQAISGANSPLEPTYTFTLFRTT